MPHEKWDMFMVASTGVILVNEFKSAESGGGHQGASTELLPN